jgi:hypothetical protein
MHDLEEMIAGALEMYPDVKVCGEIIANEYPATGMNDLLQVALILGGLRPEDRVSSKERFMAVCERRGWRCLYDPERNIFSIRLK